MFGNHQRMQEVTEPGQEVSEMTTAQNHRLSLFNCCIYMDPNAQDITCSLLGFSREMG